MPRGRRAEEEVTRTRDRPSREEEKEEERKGRKRRSVIRRRRRRPRGLSGARVPLGIEIREWTDHPSPLLHLAVCRNQCRTVHRRVAIAIRLILIRAPLLLTAGSPPPDNRIGDASNTAARAHADVLHSVSALRAPLPATTPLPPPLLPSFSAANQATRDRRGGTNGSRFPICDDLSSIARASAADDLPPARRKPRSLGFFPPPSLSQHVGRAAYLINAANGSERGYLRRNFGR